MHVKMSQCHIHKQTLGLSVAMSHAQNGWSQREIGHDKQGRCMNEIKTHDLTRIIMSIDMGKHENGGSLIGYNSIQKFHTAPPYSTRGNEAHSPVKGSRTRSK